MKTAVRVLIGLCLVTIFAAAAEAKEWRGIVPLRSTREDVTRALGPSPDANDLRANYSLEGEDVYIVFSTRDSLADECVKQLPLGTVLQIEVRPKTGVSLADLRLQEGRLKKFDPSDPPGVGYDAYADTEEGVVVRTRGGKVEHVVYLAAAADRQRCPSYYQNFEGFVGLTVEPPIPDVALNCPTGQPRAGELLVFSVNLGGVSPNLEPTYRWELSAGRIVRGQGTGSITVNTRGLGGRRLKATVEVGGSSEDSSKRESCEVQIAPARRSARRPRSHS